MEEIILRFFLGGAIVTAFAAIADTLKPKSFAGLFGAAPSVALATLGMTLHRKGLAYGAVEGRSMIAGAIAFLVYACVARASMGRLHARAFKTTFLAMPVWGLVAAIIWFLVLRS